MLSIIGRRFLLRAAFEREETEEEEEEEETRAHQNVLFVLPNFEMMNDEFVEREREDDEDDVNDDERKKKKKREEDFSCTGETRGRKRG